MTKLDFLMTLMGIAAYVAIMIDLRNYEQKVANFELYQEKRRIYLQNMNRKRVEEKRPERPIAAKKVKGDPEAGALEGTAEKLGSSDI